MRHTEIELAKNIYDNLDKSFEYEVSKHRMPRIDLTLSIEQARWLGRKMQEIIGGELISFFEDKPWNFEYELSENEQLLPKFFDNLFPPFRED